MPGLVNVMYCRAPAKLLYSVGLEIYLPSLSPSFDFVSIGVVHGLQSLIPDRFNISSAYCS